MSSRAIRRAQRELEEKKRLEKLESDNKIEDDVDEESEEDASTAKPGPSMFAMLNTAEEDGEEDGEEEEESAVDKVESSRAVEVETAKKSTAKRKKKKKSKNKSAASDAQNPQDNEASQLDEIDHALRNLDAEDSTSQSENPANMAAPTLQEINSLFAIDTQHLHVSNEMRRLFGRAALEDDTNADEAGDRRRRNRNQQGGLAAALRGQRGQGGGLTSLGLRRNIFIQGKEDWPRATSGGLGMEVVEQRADGVTEYAFVRSNGYVDVQRRFEACEASLDPNRIVQLLAFNRKCHACRSSCRKESS